MHICGTRLGGDELNIACITLPPKMPSKYKADGRRHYICNIVSHWLRPCSTKDRRMRQGSAPSQYKDPFPCYRDSHHNYKMVVNTYPEAKIIFVLCYNRTRVHYICCTPGLLFVKSWWYELQVLNSCGVTPQTYSGAYWRRWGPGVGTCSVRTPRAPFTNMD